MTIGNSKRWRATLVFLGLNFVTFWLALYKGNVSMSEVGIGLAALNAPLYGYLFAETWRPSNTQKAIQTPIKAPLDA